MGWFDNIANAFSGKPQLPPISVQELARKWLQFGEWHVRRNEAGTGYELWTVMAYLGPNSCPLVLCHLLYSGVKTDEFPLSFPDMVTGEKVEASIDLTHFDERKLQIATELVVQFRDRLVVSEYGLDDKFTEEDSDCDDQEDADEEGDGRPIQAGTRGLATEIVSLGEWEVTEEAGEQPLIAGLLRYMGGTGFPAIITSRQLQVIVHGVKGKRLGNPTGFANSFTLERNQGTSAFVDLTSLNLDHRTFATVSAVTIEFRNDNAIRQGAGSQPVGMPTPQTPRLEPVFFFHAGKSLGPFSMMQVKQLADAGLLLPTAQVSQDGQQTWVAAGTVKELFVQVQSPRPVVSVTTSQSDEWHYAQEGKQFGPLSTAQLRQMIAAGQLPASVMVWKAGLQTWVAASQVKELAREPQSGTARLQAAPQRKDEWYYAKSGKKVGPVSMEQLRQLAASGQLLRSDMVWKEGLERWIAAQQVEGLFAKSNG